MLASLTIKNIVLIDQLSIEFSKGLCALTGETGAGKSILLDSLGLALGMRADAGLVRHGSDQASVIADFDLPSNHPVFKFLKNNGFEVNDELVLRRVLTKEGRSKAFVNDEPVSANFLKALSENLIEVHGQFDSQNLLNPINHIYLLDEYAGLETELSKVVSFWNEWKDLQQNLQEMQGNIKRARENEDYFRKSLEDLDTLSPEIGEEDKLSKLRERLMRREQILGNLNEAKQGIDEFETVSGKVWRALDALGDEGQVAVDAMESVNAEIQEVTAALQNLSSDIENGEYSLTEIDDRLFALRGQARKHECNIDELPNKREEIAQALNEIKNQDSNLADLIHACDISKEEYENNAKALSKKRHQAGEKMATLVMKELVPLKLEKARFEVLVEELDQENWSKNGIDKVQFLIATNSKAKAGAINKIASGGELSRFTLALKVVLAKTGVAQSLVFDEVDSGIGGATAAAVGERLAHLAKLKQILVVTHSPQVAAMANNHWVVSKTGKEDIKTNIIPLSKEQDRQEEIARMLAGAQVTKEARAAASKLLESGAA